MDGDDLLRRKQVFYTHIDEAFAESDEEPDVGRQGSVRALQNVREGMVADNAHDVHKSTRSTPVLNRIPAFNKPSCRHLDRFLQTRPSSNRGNNPLRLSKASIFSDVPPEGAGKATLSSLAEPSAVSSNRVPSSTTPAVIVGKRKRRNMAKQVPEDQQIFKGLHFYFFPNDDKNPARKMRIAKAIEFGAQWEREMNKNITHVVVDKLMQYPTVLKYLKMNSLPNSVHVVSEIYLSECISYHALLNVGQPQFRVKGYVAPEHSDDPATAAPTFSINSVKPLELKLADEKIILRQLARQEISEEEISLESATSVALLLQDSDPVEDFYRQSPVNANRPADPQATTTEEFEFLIQRARDLQHIPPE